jgi:type III secretory pathway component EscT
VILGGLVAVLIWPSVEPLAAVPGSTTLLLMLVREGAVGAAMGFLCALPFHAVSSAGRLIDGLRGANLAEIISPTLDARTSPTAELYLRLTTLWFLASGAYRLVLFLFADSFLRLPLDWAPAQLAPGPLLEGAIAATGAVVAGALALALPTLGALLLADLSIGALGRAAPQLGLQAILMPVRSMLGVALVLLTLGGLLSSVAAEVALLDTRMP